MKRISILSASLLALFILIQCEKEKEEIKKPFVAVFHPQLTYGSVSDNDGNTYKTIQIGTQTWMAENLKTTKYRDGSAIQNASTDIAWSYAQSGAYCWYNNDINNKPAYGALYNWLTVTDGRGICPSGWHVPSAAEFETLISLYGQDNAGGKLKEAGISHWYSPNTGADNASGFTALPGGGRQMGGSFAFLGSNGFWWTTDATGTGYSWTRYISYNYAYAYKYSDSPLSGFSVRCLKN